MGTHTRKPPAPAHILASMDRDLEAAARGDQAATRRLRSLNRDCTNSLVGIP
jgi:hypothetical protein